TLMAEGASNTDIANCLFISDAAVRKHVGNLSTGLGLLPTDENRRVRAILTFLQTHETYLPPRSEAQVSYYSRYLRTNRSRTTTSSVVAPVFWTGSLGGVLADNGS